MIPEYRLFHGAAICALIDQSPFELAISHLGADGRLGFYILNRRVGLYVKHSTARLTPWQFSFSGQNIEQLRELRSRCATTGERTFRRTNKEASDYADRCRFAHTFKGSFGLAIESPVGFNDQTELAFIEPTIPFGRKVIRRIANGLQSVMKSFSEDSVSPILEAADGLNANMCSELVSIIDRTEIPRIDIAFVLSPEWEPDVPAPPTFHIDARYRELLKDASARLTTEDDAQPVTVVGRIVNLPLSFSMDCPGAMQAAAADRCELPDDWPQNALSEAVY